MKRSGVVLLLLAVVACSGDPLQGTGVDCDPMAYQLDNQVWVLADGKRIRLSEDGLIGANPSVSSDGTEITYASGVEGNLDLFVVDVDGSDRRLLWGGELLQSESDWSPDDTVVVFDQHSQQEGPLQIFTIPADGSTEPVQLTDGRPNGKPKWGSDGRILFLSLWDADEQEIYSMNPDGSNAFNLTNNPSRDVLAELSPDGSAIVFASDRSRNGDFDVWLMDRGGSNPRRLTERTERETNPTWSSDGRHIIYRSDRAPVGLWYLWYMSSDGSDQRPLLEDGWLASCP
jgi:TolB protein